MPINLDYILVFKTSLQNERDLLDISPVLNTHHWIEQWNVDLQDRDRILRIVVNQPIRPQQIIGLVSACGFECTELIS